MGPCACAVVASGPGFFRRSASAWRRRSRRQRSAARHSLWAEAQGLLLLSASRRQKLRWVLAGHHSRDPLFRISRPHRPMTWQCAGCSLKVPNTVWFCRRCGNGYESQTAAGGASQKPKTPRRRQRDSSAKAASFKKGQGKGCKGGDKPKNERKLPDPRRTQRRRICRC